MRTRQLPSAESPILVSTLQRYVDGWIMACEMSRCSPGTIAKRRSHQTGVGNPIQAGRVDKRPGRVAFGRTSSGRKYQFRPLIAGTSTKAKNRADWNRNLPGERGRFPGQYGGRFRRIIDLGMRRCVVVLARESGAVGRKELR